MWVSERTGREPVREAAAEVGVVTLGGNPAGVNLGGERRWLTVCAPGGYAWCPAEGDRVLVLKAGGEGETPCIVGAVQSQTLKPGQVCLTGEDCAIRLEKGTVELEGEVLVDGMTLEEYIRNIMLGG